MKLTNVVIGIVLSSISVVSYADCVSTIDDSYLDNKMQFAQGYEAADSFVNCKKPTHPYDKAVCSSPKLKRLDSVSVQSVISGLANQQKWELEDSQIKSYAKKEYQYRYKKAGKTPEAICKFLIKELDDTAG